MRGKTNAIDVGVSVIGEVQLCEVAESSRIEKGEFVETFYRGKISYLLTILFSECVIYIKLIMKE